MRKRSVLVLALALAGCGGDDGGGRGTAGEATRPGNVAEQERQLALDNAYDNGLDTCSQYSRKDIAAIYGVENDPEAIAKAVAVGQAGDPELREQTRRGCLAAFK